MTIMNSLFRENPLGDTDNRPQRQPFDATDILTNYVGYNFGCQQLKTIHLSQLHTEASDGFYEITAAITF